MISPEVIIAYLESQQSSTVGQTSQKMSGKTGEAINKYPASRSLVNHTATDKIQTWKNREEECGGKQSKIRSLKAE